MLRHLRRVIPACSSSNSSRTSSRNSSIAAATAWQRLQKEAEEALDSSDRFGFGLMPMIKDRIFSRSSLAESLSVTIGRKFDNNAAIDVGSMCAAAFAADPSLVDAAAADLARWIELDPAASGYLRIFLFFKGFHSVQCARVAHSYWNRPGGGGRFAATALQSEMADCFGVDIHPASQWGTGITMDHGGGCVIGETAVIGDNVYLMHDVTLGSTGTVRDHDRHPKIGRGAFLAAKCTVLGNVRVGQGAVVGAHTLVTKDVPDGYTAVGMPPTFRLLPPNKLRGNFAPSGQPMPPLLEYGEGI